MEALHERGQRQVFPGAGAGPRPHWPPEGQLRGSGRPPVQPGEDPGDPVANSASKSSIRRFVITEKAPTRAFSWLKAATTAFTFKTLFYFIVVFCQFL